jgi:hypothetical protein
MVVRSHLTNVIAAALATWDNREVLLRCLVLGCAELHYPEIGKLEVVLKRRIETAGGEKEKIVRHTLLVDPVTGVVLAFPDTFSEDVRVTYLEMVV